MRKISKKKNSDDDDQVQIEELWNQTTNQKPEVSTNQKEEMAQFGTNAESLLYLQECINDLQVISCPLREKFAKKYPGIFQNPIFAKIKRLKGFPINSRIFNS